MRAFLKFTAALGAVLWFVASAQAQTWPNRTIRWIVPYPAGGGTDVVARAVGAKLSQALGQPVVIENKSGGDLIPGTQALAQADPDGYTIGYVFDTLAIHAVAGKPTPYDAEKDFAPIIRLADVPMMLMANSAQTPKTFQELVAKAKADPKWLTFASIGPGSPHELAFLWLKHLVNIEALMVPYRGVSPALQDLVGGQVKTMFLGGAVGDAMIKEGKIHQLGISTAKRLKRAPDVPTFLELGVPFEFVSFYGVAAPRATPPEIVKRLNEEIIKAMASPELTALYQKLGIEFSGGTPDDFKAQLKANLDTYRKIFKDTGAKL